jgi:AcrR family transcriptional regulator
MPRAGLNTSQVVASAAELSDETGIGSVSLAAVAGRLGVKAPALYKHVDGASTTCGAASRLWR